MCERQISHPSNTILYCSEACRRKDSAKPLSASASAMSPMVSSPPTSPPPSSTPTLRGAVAVKPSSSSPPDYPVGSSRIPTDIHHFRSDLDPTEWKPKLPYRASGSSEAFTYLSRFHEVMTAGDGGEDSDPLRSENRGLRHKSTASLSTLPTTATTTPSLGNTPTTMASTSSTSTSFDGRYDGNNTNNEYGFAFSTRPLPPRRNPMYHYSASTSYVKGIDLVTPHIPPLPPPTVKVVAASTSVPSGSYDDNNNNHNSGGYEDFWGKKIVVMSGGGTPRANGGDGLGALFATPRKEEEEEEEKKKK
ncbi:hypothetical protein LTS17_011885 [Exophiala oligosperma]